MNTNRTNITNTIVSPVGSGTITVGGQYGSGAIVNIVVTLARGYHFVKWSDNSTNTNRTLTALESDIDIMAIFEADTTEDDDEENPGGNGSAPY